VAGILATWLLTLSAQAQAPQGPVAQRPVGTSVAVIDINYVFKKFHRFKSQLSDITADAKAFEAWLGEERNRLAKQGEKLKEFHAGSAPYKQLEEDIAEAQANLQVKMQMKRKELVEGEARVYYNAYTEIVDQVAQVAERYGIQLVLRFNGEQIDPQKRETVVQGVNRTVVHQRNLNITDMVLERLNRGTPVREAEDKTPHIPLR
jgi:Skp family chaperone for outer membrane proteins